MIKKKNGVEPLDYRRQEKAWIYSRHVFICIQGKVYKKCILFFTNCHFLSLWAWVAPCHVNACFLSSILPLFRPSVRLGLEEGTPVLHFIFLTHSELQDNYVIDVQENMHQFLTQMHIYYLCKDVSVLRKRNSQHMYILSLHLKFCSMDRLTGSWQMQ